MRVNGEDYERIELHPGDVIELGHVKLRFVGAARDLRLRPARRRRGAVPGQGRADAGRRCRWRRSRWWRVSARRRASPASTAPAAGAAQAPSPAAPPCAASSRRRRRRRARARGDARRSRTDAGRVLAEAGDRGQGEDWDAALSTLDQLDATRRTAPRSAAELATVRRDAADLRRKVETERQAALAFAQFDEASGRQELRRGAGPLRRDPRRQRLQEARAPALRRGADAVRVAEHLTAAEKSRSAGQVRRGASRGRRRSRRSTRRTS